MEMYVNYFNFLAITGNNKSLHDNLPKHFCHICLFMCVYVLFIFFIMKQQEC